MALLDASDAQVSTFLGIIVQDFLIVWLTKFYTIAI